MIIYDDMVVAAKKDCTISAAPFNNQTMIAGGSLWYVDKLSKFSGSGFYYWIESFDGKVHIPITEKDLQAKFQKVQ